MDKVIKNLKLVRQFQNVILGCIVLLAILYGVVPDRESNLRILLIGVMIGISASLVIMGFTLKVFRDVAKLNPTFRTSAIWAGWLSVIVGIYTLGMWRGTSLFIQVGLGQVGLDQVTVFSSAFLGLVVLAIHIYMTKVALAKLRKTTAA